MNKRVLSILFPFLLILLVSCSSDVENKGDKQEAFEPDEEIKPFKVANIMPYYKDGKWGYANKNGEIVIPCKYDACGFFSDGMAWVEKDWRFGFIDTTGQLAIEHQYLSVENFHNGVAIVRSNNYKGVIDKNNNVLIPFKYRALIIADDSLICFKQNRQWGILTIEGALVVNPIYDYLFQFQNGYAVVLRKNKYGVLSQKGEEVVTCKYEELLQTRDNNFIVKNKTKDYKDIYGVVNSTGKIIVPITYKNIQEVVNNTSFNHLKDSIIDFKYSGLNAVNPNLVAASFMGKWGYVNLKGDTIIPFQFNDAYGFINNYAIVKTDAYYGMINTEEETIVPFEFDEIKYAEKNIVKVYKDDKYGFYNLNGQKLTDCIYDDIDYTLNGHDRFLMAKQGYEEKESKFGRFINNYALVGINGRLGAINKKGKEIIKPYYHRLSPFDENGIAIATYNGVKALINNKGELLTELKYKSIMYDLKSGYYYAQANIKNEPNGEMKDFNIGYFDFDGIFYSNAKNGIKKIKSEEDIIFEIREEYQHIIAGLKNEVKGKTYAIDDAITASLTANRLMVTDKNKQLTYEYYFNQNLNPDGPFFILKSDKSYGKAEYDRFYFYKDQIVRWVDKTGEKRIVANAEYAPEHKEHFKARVYFAKYTNEQLLYENPKDKEVEQIRMRIAEINNAISQGKYKKGDVYETPEGSGGSGYEEYFDNKGRMIYKYEYKEGDYFSSSTEEYCDQGELIYLNSKSSIFSWLFEYDSFDKGGSSKLSSETFCFSDGTQRTYETKTFDRGEILFIIEQ